MVEGYVRPDGWDQRSAAPISGETKRLIRTVLTAKMGTGPPINFVAPKH